MWSELSWEGYAHLHASLPRCVPCSTLGTTAEDCTSLFFLFVFQIWFVVLYLSSHKSILNIVPASGLWRKTIELHLCACTRETPQDLAALVAILYAYIRPRTVGGVMQRLCFPFAACHFLFTDVRFYSGPRFLLSSCISKTKCTHRCEQGSWCACCSFQTVF